MAKRAPHRCRIRRGDLVMVVTGADRGVQGRVLRLVHDDQQVVVEGVNLVYRHVRRSQKNPQGGRVRRESPIHLSNVMLMDPEKHVPTRVGRVVGEGKASRIAKRSGAMVDADAGAKKGRKGRKSKE